MILAFKVADGTQVFSYQAPAGVNCPPAVSGDYIYFPAGAPYILPGTGTDGAPKATLTVVALKLGGEVQAAPAATPAS